MPWEPGETIAAGFAVANLTNYLMSDLKGPKGVHVESLMTVLGALAGFSAQHAIWETVVKPGKLPEHGGADPSKGAFVVAGTESAEKFYFGDLLNSYLVPQNAAFGPGQYNLWNYLAAGVQQCGRQPVGIQELGQIFQHAAATVGTAQFAIPRLPRNHMPAMMPRDALLRAWPKARLILSRDDAPGMQGKALSPGCWPAVVALVAQKLLVAAKDQLDPPLSMRIVFEAAIPMSKVDPTTVP